MGLMENLGRVATSYMDEKAKLQEAGEKRKRTRMGHGFWPHEVLRDTILFAFMAAVLLFYAWLIPPPLHGAADPYAQAGFVFPDWYVFESALIHLHLNYGSIHQVMYRGLNFLILR